MTTFTAVEEEIIRAGVVNSLAMVAEADEEGVLGMLKEMRATSKAMKGFPTEIRQILDADAGTPDDYQDPAQDTAAAYVGRAREVLAAKRPDLLPEFTAALVEGAERIAEAAKGTSPREAAIIEEIRQACA